MTKKTKKYIVNLTKNPSTKLSHNLTKESELDIWETCDRFTDFTPTPLSSFREIQQWISGAGLDGGSLFILFLCEFPSLELEGKNQQNPHLPYQTQSLSPHVKVAPSLKLVSWLFVFIETPLQFLKISSQKICLNFCRVWLNSYFVRRLFEYLLGRQLFKSQTVLTGNLLQWIFSPSSHNPPCQLGRRDKEKINHPSRRVFNG